MPKFLNLILVISAFSTLFANELEQMFQNDSIFEPQNDTLDYFEDQYGSWSLKTSWSHLSQKEDSLQSNSTLLNPYSISYKNQLYNQRLYIKNSGSKYFKFEAQSQGLEIKLGRQKVNENAYAKSSDHTYFINTEGSNFNTYQGLFFTTSPSDSLNSVDSISHFKGGIGFNSSYFNTEHFGYLNSDQIQYLNHFYLGGLHLSFYGPKSSFYLLEIQNPKASILKSKYALTWYNQGINSDFYFNYPQWQTKAFSSSSTLFFDLENKISMGDLDFSFNPQLWQSDSEYFYGISTMLQFFKEHFFYFKSDIYSNQHYKYKFKTEDLELSQTSTLYKNKSLKESRQSFIAKLDLFKSFSLAYKINYHPRLEQFLYFKLGENPDASHWQINGRLDIKHPPKQAKELKFLLQVSYTFQSID